MKTITWKFIRKQLADPALSWDNGFPANEVTADAVGRFLAEAYGVKHTWSDTVQVLDRLVWTPVSIWSANLNPRVLRLRGSFTNPSALSERNQYLAQRIRLQRKLESAKTDPLLTSFRDRVIDLLDHVALAPNSSFSQGLFTKTPRRMYEYSHAIGLEFECYGAICRLDLIKALPLWTRVVTDGSIRPVGNATGHEIRVLLNRQLAEPKLHYLCTKFAQLNLRVNKSCGLHIHLDARSMTWNEACARGRTMDKWLHAMQELLPASRRENNYCKWGIAINDRYRAVNVYSWHAHKTIEVRVGSATLDYTKALAWIRLVELVRAMAKGPKVGSCLSVLEQLPLCQHDLAFWRSRHRELNPSLYTANATDTTTDSE